jgi:hypothetical protein
VLLVLELFAIRIVLINCLIYLDGGVLSFNLLQSSVSISSEMLVIISFEQLVLFSSGNSWRCSVLHSCRSISIRRTSSSLACAPQFSTFGFALAAIEYDTFKTVYRLMVRKDKTSPTHSLTTTRGRKGRPCSKLPDELHILQIGLGSMAKCLYRTISQGVSYERREV